jgi:hypothetical protein
VLAGLAKPWNGSRLAAGRTYARAKGYQFALNGDVEDYYRVAPMTFRAERAGVSVRLLRVSDGTVMAAKFRDSVVKIGLLTRPAGPLRQEGERHEARE